MIRLPLCSTLFPYTTLFRSFSVLRAMGGGGGIVGAFFGCAGGLPTAATRAVDSRVLMNPKFEMVCGLPKNARSEEHTSELQSLRHLVCRLLLEKKKKNISKE